ncbi:hypothetical protein [Marinobacter sp. M5B]|uniref:hypothetical protein n=1 Tax=Marinobacter sp. M5B TaxID=3141535 RepID=UPI0036D29832
MLKDLMGVESDQLEELVALFDIPDNPKALYNVLSVVLRVSKIGGFEGFPYEQMNRLEPLCLSLKRAIEGSPDHQRLLLCSAGTGFAISLRGLLTKAPLYCLLFFSLEDSTGATLRRLQQAGIVIWSSPHLDAKRRKQILYQYQFAVRTMLESNLGRNWLGGINPAELCSLRDVRKSFVEMENRIGYYARYEKNLEVGDRRRGLEISKLARKAILSIDVARGAHSVGAVTKKRGSIIVRNRSWSVRGPQQLADNWIQCCVPAFGDFLNPENSIHLVRRESNEADNLSELAILDMEPSELESQEEYLLSDSDTLPLYAREFKNRIRMRGMAQRIETHSQFLPFSISQFTQRELKHLFRALDDVSTDKKYGIEKVLVAAMFATSSWMGRAQNLTLVTSEEKIVRGESEILYFNLSSSTWLIPALAPEYRTSTDKAAEASSRWVRCDFVEIPDRFGFKQILERVFASGTGAALFNNRRNLGERTKRFLKSISPRHTLERVERYLLYRTAGRYEPVQASYLFGNPINSASARTFYTSLALDYYRKVYALVCDDVLEGLNRTLRPAAFTANNEDHFLGARYCPTSDALKQVVEEIGAKVEFWRASLGLKKEAWVELHNWFTVFCSVIQAILVGARGVTEPLLSPEKITSDGIAIFRDKDGSDQFHTRSIQLHPMAWEVTKRYERHRQRILARLALVNYETFSLLGFEKSFWSFFLDPHGGLVEVRPSTISPYLQESTNLPFNSFRKYLRTRLIELEVAPEAVDALLGHASFGEQAWGKFSCVTSAELYREQRRGLDSIIKELGLRLLPGLSS